VWILPDTARRRDVILKVVPHAWQMLYERNAQALQFGLIANARLHQDLRRMHGAQ